MSLTFDGRDFHATNWIGNSVTHFDNANAAIGVGDDNSPFSQYDSQLQAEANGTNAIRKGMDSGYPSQDPGSAGDDHKIRFQSTFAEGEGNFSWLEWGIFNSTTAGGGVMHNREVEDLGSKTNKIQRIFQVDVQLTT